MSYDLGLYKDAEYTEPVEVESHQEGGTYAMNGSSEAELNITYNYGWFYYKVLDEKEGLRWLYHKQARSCIKRLEIAVETLGTNQYKDYWAATPGNAGYALNILLEWAREHPGAYFNGD